MRGLATVLAVVSVAAATACSSEPEVDAPPSVAEYRQQSAQPFIAHIRSISGHGSELIEQLADRSLLAPGLAFCERMDRGYESFAIVRGLQQYTISSGVEPSMLMAYAYNVGEAAVSSLCPEHLDRFIRETQISGQTRTPSLPVVPTFTPEDFTLDELSDSSVEAQEESHGPSMADSREDSGSTVPETAEEAVQAFLEDWHAGAPWPNLADTAQGLESAGYSPTSGWTIEACYPAGEFSEECAVVLADGKRIWMTASGGGSAGWGVETIFTSH